LIEEINEGVVTACKGEALMPKIEFKKLPEGLTLVNMIRIIEHVSVLICESGLRLVEELIEMGV
jgi:hypothetical protein